MMRITMLAAAMLLACAGAQAAKLAKSSIVECTPQRCGDFEQNDSRIAVSAGWVGVSPDGTVTVAITGLRDKATGQILANKQLGLHYGTLFAQVNATIPLGSVTTDASGNYSGPVVKKNGRRYKFAPGGVNVGSFYINDDAVPNSSFVTGFAVAP